MTDEVDMNVPMPRCPFCHEAVKSNSDQGRQFCSDCGALHHKTCLQETDGECSACRSVNHIESKKESSTDVCGDCGGKLGFSSSGCMECGLWFHGGCGAGHKCVPRKPTPMSEEERVVWQNQLNEALEKKETLAKQYRLSFNEARGMSLALLMSIALVVLMALFDRTIVVPVLFSVLFLIGALIEWRGFRKTMSKQKENNCSIDFLQMILSDEEEEEIQEDIEEDMVASPSQMERA